MTKVQRYWSRAISTLLLLNLSAILSTLLTAFSFKPTPDLVISAAADLAPLRTELTALAARHNLRVQFTFGSSGLLARQIQQGAPYDVYLSANESFVSNLASQGRLVSGTGRVYAYGRLALWSKIPLKGLERLLSPEIRHVAIANPQHAPYGAAARQALERQGLWERIQPKLVYGENVRQALQFAESGNAEAAIVAWSLVIHRGGVLLPAAWHDPLRQAGAVVSGSRAQPQAIRFLDLFSSPEGIAVLRRYGFEPAGTSGKTKR
jgi:molybdate transport system substrate-binding protein